MSFLKYFLFLTIIIISTSCVLLAQKDIPILTSICVQNAYTKERVSGVRVIIDELDNNDNVVKSDSLGGTVFISTYFIPNHKYRLQVNKEGYHFKDTVIIPKATSRSRKQRLGLPLYPMVCFNLKGQVIDAISSQKITTGKLIIKNLSDRKSSYINIQNGYFKYCGKCNHQYQIKSIVEGYLDRTELVDLHSNNCYTPHEQTIQLDISVTRNYDNTFFDGESIFLPNFTFVDNSTQLSVKGEQEISRLIQFLNQEPKVFISISVHAQSFLERSRNRKIAEQRARFLEHRLTKAGIAAYRYLLKCKGKVRRNYFSVNKNQQILLSIRK
ncbi:MAG: OmpA family protein [Saprospiraceae bacterium]|nr:OmpA family protein [Saprospiraceae bacterium]